MRVLCLKFCLLFLISLSANESFAQIEDPSWGLGVRLGFSSHRTNPLDMGIETYLPYDFQLGLSYSYQKGETSLVQVLSAQLEEHKGFELRKWSISLSRPLDAKGESSFLWEFRYVHSSFTTDASEKWYPYKDRPYEKRIRVHHDAIIHNLGLGMAWRPRIGSSKFYFDVSLMPSLEWYDFPDDRNTTSDSLWAVEQDFSKNPDEEKFLAWNFRMGFIYRIF